MEHKNKLLAGEFYMYCMEHPEMRFWQALRNWSGYGYIWADAFDTFYWEGKDK
jgi:hypothetical protein